MIRPSDHRLATILLGAAYALAHVAGGLPHDHAHAPGTAHCQHDHADHASHDVCAAHDEDVESAILASPAATGGASHDDDCTICRAAGQRVLVAETYQVAPLCDVCTPLAIVRASQPLTTFARTTHSRAPPHVG